MNELLDATHIYLGRCKSCGEINAAMVDIGDASVGEAIKEFIDSGLVIDRIPADQKFTMKRCGCQGDQR